MGCLRFTFGVWMHRWHCNASEVQQMESQLAGGEGGCVAEIPLQVEKPLPGEVSPRGLCSPPDLVEAELKRRLLLFSSYSHSPTTPPPPTLDRVLENLRSFLKRSQFSLLFFFLKIPNRVVPVTSILVYLALNNSYTP